MLAFPHKLFFSLVEYRTETDLHWECNLHISDGWSRIHFFNLNVNSFFFHFFGCLHLLPYAQAIKTWMWETRGYRLVFPRQCFQQRAYIPRIAQIIPRIARNVPKTFLSVLHPFFTACSVKREKWICYESFQFHV